MDSSVLRRRVPRTVSGWLRWLAVMLVLAMVVNVGVPTSGPWEGRPAEFPLANLWTWLTSPSSWAAGTVPKSPLGGAFGGGAVSAGSTKAKGGTGHARGRGKGELPLQVDVKQPRKVQVSGPVYGDRSYIAGKSKGVVALSDRRAP